ncbi:unnamed protein product [Pleuronectes platessa]|uniref:Uncharacterized protein n=1 Tax=Pleuronectes platessa TaxID=8262 RepID=A0A9N7YY16_PLEPL|nr:unnamed protein product [Pleuronectes platessa]
MEICLLQMLELQRALRTREAESETGGGISSSTPISQGNKHRSTPFDATADLKMNTSHADSNWTSNFSSAQNGAALHPPHPTLNPSLPPRDQLYNKFNEFFGSACISSESTGCSQALRGNGGGKRKARAKGVSAKERGSDGETGGGSKRGTFEAAAYLALGFDETWQREVPRGGV